MRKPFYFLFILMAGLSGCSKAGHTSTRDPFRASIPAPMPPQWIEQMPAEPEWWSNIVANYDEGTPLSNRWAHVQQLETQITEMVRNGISPVKERRELIKYLTLFSESPSFSQVALRLGDPNAVSDARKRLKIKIAEIVASNAPQEMKIEIAETYEKLGDYKRSTRGYAEIVKGYPGDYLLYSLAIEYERLGEKETAIQIYKFMGKAFPSNSMGAKISMRGIGCLNGTTNNYRFLKKPDWWNAYRNLPDWWTNVLVTLPKISCFEDGVDFIFHNLWNKDDPRKTVKAWTQLSEFTPITFNEEERAIRSTSLAYSKIGDHRRAIETEWKLLEKYPGDGESAITLKFIASEFEKLGEPARANEFRQLAR